MNETQKYSSGQAQHLAEWKARQQQARGKIIYFPLARCEPPEELEQSWQEFLADLTGKAYTIAAVVLGLLFIGIQFAKWLGWF